MIQKAGIPDLQKTAPFVGALVFTLSFYWYSFPGRYVLFANQDVTLFLTTSDYFLSFMNRPGGLLEYTGSFLSQLLRFRFAGALLLGLTVSAFYFLAVRVFSRISVQAEGVAAGLITAALVMAMHNYYPHRLHHSLGLLLAISLALMVPARVRGKRIFMVVSVPAFYMACGGFVWFYLVIWLITAGFERGKIMPESLLWGIPYPVLLVLILGRFVYLYPIRDLVLNPLPVGQVYGSAPWPSLFAVWLGLVPLLAWLVDRYRWRGAGRLIAISTIALVITVLVLNFSYNRKHAQFFALEKLAVEEEWEGLLRYADQHPSGNLFGTFYTNLALCYQGRLCSDLLNYPQPFGRRGLCFEWDAKGEVLRRGSDFFWAIGYINEAHHWAFESMVVDGITRRNLKRLIETELVTGNFPLAEKYIGIMKRTLFDRPLAMYYSNLLEHPGSIREDPLLGPRSRIRIRGDFFADGIDLEQNLQSMINSEIKSQPVFDYLMALYLLERRVDDVAAFLPHYLEDTSSQLPRLLDEALLVYKITRREENQTNIGVSEPTMRRFEEYAGILRQYRDQKEAARMLHPRFGNSFWFYLNFSELIGY